MTIRRPSMVVARASSIVTSACGGSGGDTPTGAPSGASGSGGAPDGGVRGVSCHSAGEHFVRVPYPLR